MSVTSMQFSSGSSVATSSDHSSSISTDFVAQRQTVVTDGRSMPVVVSQQRLLELGEEKEFLEFPKFTEEEIKNALKAEAEKHPMWRTAAVKRMKIVNINPSVAFRYTLETFTETRSTYECCEQYGGRDLDTTPGVSPSVWEVPCRPKTMFTEEIITQELPGSAYMIKCESCKGECNSHCYSCRGVGTLKCTLCNSTGMRTGVPHPLVGPGVLRGMKTNSGNGARSQLGVGTPMQFDNGTMLAVSSAGLTAMDLCDKCRGRGIRECAQCEGRGKTTCVTCAGHGKMKRYTTLKIRFEIDKSEYLHETGLPDDIFRRVTGEVVMMETRAHVYPMRNFPIEVLNEQSRRLVQCHLSKHQGSARILQQRHRLEGIPVACVNYDLNGQKGSCWVIGLERLAYVPQYPKKCCIL